MNEDRHLHILVRGGRETCMNVFIFAALHLQQFYSPIWLLMVDVLKKEKSLNVSSS